ncbi:FkbM family methyltransferase [Microcoleus sp. B4-D4]|uniref:FkbM family methyltransferase n=1 Tax=Microcoleus sp. B4-D4 TaxID=2818667 RepID=UPI002FD76595
MPQNLTATAIQSRILRYATLKKELKYHNSQEKLTALTVLVTERQGKMKISIQHITEAHSLLTLSSIEESQIKEVETYSLADFFKELPSKIDIINLDTKWLSPFVFEEMQSLITKNSHATIFIVFSCSDFDKKEEAKSFIYKILRSGFSIAEINNDQKLSVISEDKLMSQVSVRLVLKKVTNPSRNEKKFSEVKQNKIKLETPQLSNKKNDISDPIHGSQQTSLSEQSEVKALIGDKEKYKLDLRLSGIVEDISRNSKPKVIEKLETLCHTYDNAGLIDWEKELELGYRRFLSFNSTVIDIGGHAGRHSDIFINQIGCKEVYIFEPIPSKYEHLLNRYLSNQNVTVKQVALSSSVGKSEFIINHGAPEESGLKERIYNNPELKILEKIIVATDTIDNIFRDASAIEYIKIDTEGGEIDILRGAVSIIQKFRPFISVEYGKPSYSAYAHNQDTLFLYSQEQQYVITDLFGNPIENIDIWRECVDTFYWDYYLVPQEKLSFFSSTLTAQVSQVVRETNKIELKEKYQPCNPDQMLQKKEDNPPKTPFDYHKYPPRLNLGCGYDIRSGYLNIDFQQKHNPDLLADIRLLDMLPSGYYEEIVAQDCLEHFPRTETELALKEWHRLLKIGGLLKLRVPDIASAVAILTSNTDINHQKGWNQMIFGTQAYTGDYHFTSFTEVLVRHYLEESGFNVNEIKLFDRWLLDIIAEKIN